MSKRPLASHPRLARRNSARRTRGIESLEPRTMLDASTVLFGKGLAFVADFSVAGDLYKVPKGSGPVQVGYEPSGGGTFKPLFDLDLSETDEDFVFTLAADPLATALKLPSKSQFKDGKRTFGMVGIDDLSIHASDLLNVDSSGKPAPGVSKFLGTPFSISGGTFTASAFKLDLNPSTPSILLNGSGSFNSLNDFAIPFTDTNELEISAEPESTVSFDVKVTDFGSPTPRPLFAGVTIAPKEFDLKYSTTDSGAEVFTIGGAVDLAFSGNTVATTISLQETGGTLDNLTFKISTAQAITVHGLKFDATSLEFDYMRVGTTDQFQVSGAATATLNKDNKISLKLQGKNGEPGLVIEDGTVKSVEASLSTDISLEQFKIKTHDLTISYINDGTGQTVYQVTGSASLPSFYNATVAFPDISNLAPDKRTGLLIEDGVLKLESFEVGFDELKLGAFTVKEFDMVYKDGDKGLDLYTDLKLAFPGGFVVDASLTLKDGEIDEIGLDAKFPTGEGIEIPGTGLEIIEIGAEVLNIEDPANLIVMGNIGMVFGSDVQILGKTVSIFHASGSFIADADGLKLEADAQFGAYSQDVTDANGHVNTVWSGVLGEGSASFDADWADKTYTATLDVSLIDDIFHIHADLEFHERSSDSFDLLIDANATLNVPKDIPIIGGMQLADVSFLLDYHENQGIASGFVAAWLELDVIWTFDVGLKYDIATEQLSLLGTADVHQLEAQERQDATTYTYSQDFTVGDGINAATFTVDWAGGLGTETVGLAITRLDGSTVDIGPDDFEKYNIQYVSPLNARHTTVIRIVGSSTDPYAILDQGTYTFKLVSHGRLDKSQIEFTGATHTTGPLIQLEPASQGESGEIVNVEADVLVVEDPTIRPSTLIRFYRSYDPTGANGVLFAEAAYPTGANPQPGQSVKVSASLDLANLAANPIYIYAIIDDTRNSPVRSNVQKFTPAPPLRGQLRDANHAGISGIKIELAAVSSSDGSTPQQPLQAVAITDKDGNYSFYGLKSHTKYSITPLIPAAFALNGGASSVSVDYEGDNLNVIVDVNGNPSIRGTVFSDEVGDGLDRTGTSPLAGVPVYLDLNNNHRFDNDEPSQLSGTDGSYWFFNLIQGRVYYVGLDLGRDMVATTTKTGNRGVLILESGGQYSGIALGASPTATIRGHIGGVFDSSLPPGQRAFSPASYLMNNGDSGAFPYHDDTYSGLGDSRADGASLSGGLGRLTDGVLGSDNPAQNGGVDWVGWNKKAVPITFEFGRSLKFNAVRVFANNHDAGSPTGNVVLYAGVTLEFSNDGASWFGATSYTTSQVSRADTQARFLQHDVSATAKYVRATFQPQAGKYVLLGEISFITDDVAPFDNRPLAYEMTDGTPSHFDGEYNGMRNGESLSGGLGKLTDGITGDSDWEQDNGGIWVGWNTQNPQVIFDFGMDRAFSQVSIFANNSGSGGVSLYSSLSIDFSDDKVNWRGSQSFITSADSRADTIARFLDYAVNDHGRYVRLHFTNASPSSFVFLSEVAFNGNKPTDFKPVTYAMPNGTSGEFAYRDSTYHGTGGNPEVNGSFLSGGTGKLVDGKLGSDSWEVDGASAWVGWTGSFEITFDLGKTTSLNSFSAYFNNSNVGTVVLPDSVTFEYSNDGSTWTAARSFAVAQDTAHTSARWVSFNLDISPTGLYSPVFARYVRAHVNSHPGSFTFISEVKFNSFPGAAPGASQSLEGWSVQLIQGNTVVGNATTDSAGNYTLPYVLPNLPYRVNQVLQGGWRSAGNGSADLSYSQSALTIGHSASDVISADLDGDGHVDLAFLDATDEQVTVAYGDGKGHFSQTTLDLASIQFMGHETLARISSGHFSASHSNDLIVIGSQGTVYFLKNTGNGAFAAPALLNSGAFAGLPALSKLIDVAVGDFNNDGIDDVLVSGRVRDGQTGEESGRVLMMLSAAGIHTSNVFQTDLASPNSATSTGGLVTGDFNSDGKLDFAMNGGSDYVSVTVYWGPFRVGMSEAFGGTATSAGSTRVPGQVASGGQVAAGDIDGDGRTDIAFPTSTTSDPLYYSYQSSPGSFALQSTGLTTHSAQYQGLQLFDADGDGRLDLLAFGADGVLNVFTNQGRLPYLNQAGLKSITITSTPGSFVKVIAADLNEDGLLDLIVANNANSTQAILTNTTSSLNGHPIEPAAGEVITGLDFTDQQQGSFSGVIFEDSNRNGRREATDQGLAGVLVAAVRIDAEPGAAPVAATTRTAINGGYSFPELPKGTYEIRILGQDDHLPTGAAATSRRVTINGKGGIIDIGLVKAWIAPLPILPSVQSGSPFSFDLARTAEGADRQLRFELAKGAPDGLSVDPKTGKVTWTTSTDLAPGTYTFVVNAIDNSSPPVYERQTITIRIKGLSPRPTISGAPATGVEGTPLVFTGQPGVAASSGPIRYAWSVMKGSTQLATGDDPVFLYVPTLPGEYVVALSVTDADGQTGEISRTITVANVAPMVQAGADVILPFGRSLHQPGAFSDPGQDVWTASVDYGDGSEARPLGLNADKSFFLDHTYAHSGDYVVRITICDGSGASGSTAFVVRVAPPTSPTVVNIHRLGQAARPIELKVTFDQPLNPARARNKQNYRLVGAGRDGRFGTSDEVVIPIRAALYETGATSTTLRLARALRLGQKYRLTVNGRPPRGIASLAGKFLTGQSNGRRTRSFVSTFTVSNLEPASI